MRLIDADAFREAMYHDAFETDTSEQKWDGGLWIRYKLFERNLKSMPTIPYDMKWNPECEDCLPEGIGDCIECRKRQEGQ